MEINAIDMGQFKVFLHNTIYNNDLYVKLLINCISENFDLFNSSYDTASKKIEIKIKKTNIKKIPGYKHDVNFYYPYINKSFYSFLTDSNIYESMKKSIAMMNKEDPNREKFKLIMTNLISGSNNISLLYNLTPILDSSLILYL